MERLPLTTSGKLDRARLPAPPRVEARSTTAPENELEARLQRIWADVLETELPGMEDDFFELGGHSLLAIRLFAAIEQELGVRPPVALIFQAPTVRALAQALSGERGREAIGAWSPLVAIQRGSGEGPARRAFFCVHGLGGGVVGYAALARLLGPEQPFYGLQSYGVEPGQSADTTIEAMAARYVAAMREVQPRGPYALGGYSYGGTVAFEMARQLEAQGEAVEPLVMLDTPAPKSDYREVRLDGRFVRGFVGNVGPWLADFIALETRQRWGRTRRHLSALWNAGRAAASQGELDLRDFVDDIDDVPADRRELMRAQLDAWVRYEPGTYGGRVTVLRSPRQPLWCTYDPELGWGALARGGVEVHAIAGAHRNLLEEPYVEQLAGEMNRMMNALITAR